MRMNSIRMQFDQNTKSEDILPEISALASKIQKMARELGSATDDAVEASRFQSVAASAEKYQELAYQFASNAKQGAEKFSAQQQVIAGLTTTGSTLTNSVDDIRNARTEQQTILAGSVNELKGLIANVPLIRIASSNIVVKTTNVP